MKLSEGCILCLEGKKLVLFMTGKCNRGCFYCPLPESRMGKDVVYANERKLSNVEAIKEAIEEAELMDAKGMGITGGDPLLVLDRTIKYIKAFKKRFGKQFHCHIYVVTQNVTFENLKKLAKAGIDEIRFHPQFLNEKTYEEDIRKMTYALKLKGKYHWKVGMEIPAIPKTAKQTIKFLDKAKDIIEFLNLNELEMSVLNAPALMRRKMIWKEDSAAIKSSEKAALEIARHMKKTKIPAYYCSARTKDIFQYKNRLKRRLKSIIKPYDIQISETSLYRAALYLPGLRPGFEYENRLEKIDNVKRKNMLNRLSILRVRLMRKFRIPKNLVEVDKQKIRILTSVEIAETLKNEIKDFGLEMALVEELPTYDNTTMSLEWI